MTYEELAAVAVDIQREAELAAVGLRWARPGPDGQQQVPVGTPEHVASWRALAAKFRKDGGD